MPAFRPAPLPSRAPGSAVPRPSRLRGLLPRGVPPRAFLRRAPSTAPAGRGRPDRGLLVPRRSPRACPWRGPPDSSCPSGLPPHELCGAIVIRGAVGDREPAFRRDFLRFGSAGDERLRVARVAGEAGLVLARRGVAAG